MLQKRFVLTCVVALSAASTLRGQPLPFWVDAVHVSQPNPGGIGAVTLSGEWIDTCVPDAVSHTRTGSLIDLEVTLPNLGVGCGDAITPWSLTEEFGPLPPGEFQIRGTLVAVNPANRDIRERVSGPDLLFTSVIVPQGRFHGLGNPPNDAYVSRAFDVSSDGRVVVGHTELAPGAAGFITHEAFAWSPATGMFPLGILPGGIPGGSTGRGVSADGNVVVGDSSTGTGLEAFRWTLGSGVKRLGGQIETSQSKAAATSRDGSVVVGENEFFPPMQPDPTLPARIREAFRWTRESGMVGLGQVHPGGTSWATDVSSDGDVVVGNATLNPFIEIAYPDISEPFRWTLETGMVGLGQFPHLIAAGVPFPVQRETTAEAVSAEGTHIVGGGRLFNGVTGELIRGSAYRWTSEDGFVGLGVPTPCLACDALLPAGELDLKAVDTSADGSLVVGAGRFIDAAFHHAGDPGGVSPGGPVPEVGNEFSFLWQEGQGMRFLEEVLLTDYGFGQSGQLDGWKLGSVAAISDDGTTIVGTGTNPQGQQEAWRVVLGRTTLPGDVDFDGDVDRDDAAIVRSGLGTTSGAQFTDGDFDFDGAVDGDDLRALLLGFGKTRATFQPQGQMAAAVPEPATFILVCLLLIGSGTRRRAKW